MKNIVIKGIIQTYHPGIGTTNIKNKENITPQKLYNKLLFILFILKAFK